MANGNKEYRSDVFSMLLQNKKRALEIYNAINGTAYDDPEQIEITTLEDRSFSLTVRNDASFVLDHQLSLYEHQSTLCPNMPLRDLIYFLSMIQKRAYAKRRDLYARMLLKIPAPQFFVFYNGKESAPEQYELRLSDAFEKRMDMPQLELVCKVYNINSGKNKELNGGWNSSVRRRWKKAHKTNYMNRSVKSCSKENRWNRSRRNRRKIRKSCVHCMNRFGKNCLESCAVAIQYIFVIDVVSNKGIRNLKGVEYFTKLI